MSRFAQVNNYRWDIVRHLADTDREALVDAILKIIGRGNDAEIRRRGEGLIVLEVSKTIKHSST